MGVVEMELDLQLLGPFTVVYDGRPLDSFRSNKTQALLAYLVTEEGFAEDLANEAKGQTHGREQLMALLWPRTPQKSAQVNLRQTLYQLRQAIPEVAGADGDPTPFILSDRQTVQVNPDAVYRLDVARFLQSGALLDGEPSPDGLAEAVALYRGPFLSDFHLPDSETFEEWAAGRRATLQRMALEALETLAEHHLERADGEEAEGYARRQLALGNLRERGHRQLMRALAQQGKRNAALAHYDEYCALLEQELGVEPSEESRALYEALREGEGPVEATSLSEAKPKARTKRRLPSPPTPFVGRRREMAEIMGMLEDGCRLLTLLGPGGSGKTRLAIEVARRSGDEYADGAAFVDLAPLSDPANIPTAIATALDFRFTTEGNPRDQVLNYLANKEMLLVLDNVEHLLNMHLLAKHLLAKHLLDKHLLDKHRPDGAELISDLLQAAPGVSLLATSRVRLHLGAEYLYEVGGLSFKEDGLQEGEVQEAGLRGSGPQELESEAAEMFLEHARRVQPGFAREEADRRAVARICRLVEGMPLALELAAPWVRYLSPAEIARKLAEGVDLLESARADLPARQRSMRAAFDYSWNMLDESEQAALMKLSVFRGGAGREAASAVTGASLQALINLADHSLLSFDPASGRFAVHEVIRQIALERLEEAGEAEGVRDAHSDYYLRALADYLPDLKGRDQLGAPDAIEEDFENVRAAWEWAVRRGQWQHFPQATQSIHLFALLRNRYLEAVELFETAYQASSSPATTPQRLARAYALAAGQGLKSRVKLQKEADALAAVPELQAAVEALNDPAAVAYCRLMMSETLVQLGRPSEAIEVLEPARAYYREARDIFYRALVLWRLNFHLWRAGRHEEARELARRGLALARQIGDRYVAAALLYNLAATSNDTAEKSRYLEEAAKLQREIGERAGYARSLASLGAISLQREGDLAKARPLVEEAAAIAAEQNNPYARMLTLTVLAAHRLLAGQYEKVLAVTEEALALPETKGHRWWYEASGYRGSALLALGDVDAALPFIMRTLSWLIDKDEPDWLRASLAHCGVIIARQSRHEWATQLLALGLTNNIYRPMMEIGPLLTGTRAELEEALGEEAFAAAWERGKALDPQAVADDVLAWLEGAS